MSPELQHELRAAWLGTETRAAIATRLSIGKSSIDKFWQDEKAAGRLPKGMRPHFTNCGAGNPTTLDAEIERSEQVAELTGMRIDDADPLLARLKAAHGVDVRREIDGRASIALERLETGRRIPSPFMLAQARLILDRAMTKVRANLKTIEGARA